MPTNDFLPFGTAAGANVTTQVAYAALAARTAGFSAGVASSAQVNKALRQAGFVASAIAQFVADYQAGNVQDDGIVANFETQFVNALGKAGTGRLLRTSIYINSGGTLQVSVNGGAYANASSTFTALANTTACDVEVQGGGGGGGGTQATGAGQAAAGGGGGAGGYGFKRFTSGFSGITITVAPATTPVAGAAGATGNTSSFGALLSGLGGGGGVQGPAATLDGRYFGTAGGGSISGSADFATAGGQGGSASYSSSGTVSGAGGTSHFAPGAGSVTPNSNGLHGGYGGGGGGAATAASQPGYTGGIGGAGIIVIKEYA